MEGQNIKSEEKKYKGLIKDTFIFALGSLGSKLILFFMVPLYTNFLSKDEYGTTELVYMFFQLLLPVVSLTIYDAIVRFGMAKAEKKENVLVSGLFVSFIASLITVAVTPLLSFYPSIAEWKWYVTGYVVFNLFSTIVTRYLKVKDKNLLYAICAIAQTLTLATLNVIFLVVANFGVKGYLIAWIISQCVGIIIPFFFGGIYKDIKIGRLEKRLLKEMIIYSSPLILNDLSWWVIHSSDRIMIELMVTTGAMGVYAAAAKIPSLINVLTSIFQQSWGLSSIKEIENDNDTSFYSSVLNTLMVCVFFITLCITFVIKPFMRIYVAPEYYEGWRYVPFLLVGAGFCAISTYFGAMYGALKKSVNSMITTFISAIVNIVANYFFIIKFGALGAAIGTFISYVLIAVIRMLDVQRFVKIKINYVKFIINSIIIIVASVLTTINFHTYITNGILIVLFFIINFNDVKKIIISAFDMLRRKNEKTND